MFSQVALTVNEPHPIHPYNRLLFFPEKFNLQVQIAVVLTGSLQAAYRQVTVTRQAERIEGKSLHELARTNITHHNSGVIQKIR